MRTEAVRTVTGGVEDLYSSLILGFAREPLYLSSLESLVPLCGISTDNQATVYLQQAYRGAHLGFYYSYIEWDLSIIISPSFRVKGIAILAFFGGGRC